MAKQECSARIKGHSSSEGPGGWQFARAIWTRSSEPGRPEFASQQIVRACGRHPPRRCRARQWCVSARRKRGRPLLVSSLQKRLPKVLWMIKDGAYECGRHPRSARFPDHSGSLRQVSAAGTDGSCGWHKLIVIDGRIRPRCASPRMINLDCFSDNYHRWAISRTQNRGGLWFDDRANWRTCAERLPIR